MEFTKTLDILRNKLQSFDIQSLSFNYTDLYLVAGEDLEKLQIGYSKDCEGQDFTGTNPGDWLPSWVVIGWEGLCGDPLFVDLASPELPVFTAAHGEGNWELEKIADSLTQLFSAISYLKPLALNRENPVSVQRNPLPNCESVLNHIYSLTGCSNSGFWDDWFGPEHTK